LNFQDFLSWAERFFDEATTEPVASNTKVARRYLAASLVFSGVAVEAFVNDMMMDFASLPAGMFTIHEQGFLEERAVEFVSAGAQMGRFRLTSRQDYRGLDQKIMFLVAKFGKNTSIDKGSGWWPKFESTKKKRNKVVHPRKDDPVVITSSDAADALEVSKEIIKVVSKAVWGKEAKL
jgi:hypothetical protein